MYYLFVKSTQVGLDHQSCLVFFSYVLGPTLILLINKLTYCWWSWNSKKKSCFHLYTSIHCKTHALTSLHSITSRFIERWEVVLNWTNEQHMAIDRLHHLLWRSTKKRLRYSFMILYFFKYCFVYRNATHGQIHKGSSSQWETITLPTIV